MDQIIGRSVSSVGFSFYTAQETRKLSSIHVSNPLLFDTMNNPNPFSLYDNAMGPTDKQSKCTTCSLDYFKCPGHFGHIELASICFNPITFKLMYKLLNSLCFYCHHFRTSAIQIHHFSAKITLIRSGLLVEAIELDNVLDLKFKEKKLKKTSDSGNERIIQDEAQEDNDDIEGGSDLEELAEEMDVPVSEEDFINRINDYTQQCIATLDGKRAKHCKTTQITEALRSVEKQFMKNVPKTCASCKGQSPQFRTDAMVKVFQRGLSLKQKKSMVQKGLHFQVLDINRQKSVQEMNANLEADVVLDVDSDVDVDVDVDVDLDLDQNDDTESREDSQILDDKQMRYLTPIEIKEHLVRFWQKEESFLNLLYGTSNSILQPRVSSPEIFFISVLAVPPNKFRPLSKMNDMIYEHPQNIYLTDILKSNQLIADMYRQQQSIQSLTAEDVSSKNDMLSRIVYGCVSLQTHVNNFLDSSKAPQLNGKAAPPGIRQLLEKKEGLFRKHMMGKRVNYAARSVISPDPNIETNEIGIPPVFAVKLTYPEPVTVHNFKSLRLAVINGPNVWPGATHVESEDGTLINLLKMDLAARQAVAEQLLAITVSESTEKFGGCKKVFRHLKNGDFLLLNRQPTLHKPSIMAHTARILPGEKTIRMHYANCNTYNADFDGDEMNIHFPQTALGRAEAMAIARTDLQYLVPTDGDVLRGLIQDHVCAGVDMTSKNTLVDREEYMRLLYTALRPDSIGSANSSNPNDGNGNIESEIKIGRNGVIITMQPALIKPRALWTGKQVISTILLNLTYSHSPLNMISKSKVPAKVWENSAPEEDRVLIMDGHLLTGILDKSQFGASAHGLVHSVYEVYGPSYAGKLLSTLGRLFTCYLQLIAFTCRMDDLRLTVKGDVVRRKLIDACHGIGAEVGLEYTELDKIADTTDPATVKVMLKKQLEKVLRSDEKMAGLDSAMKSKTNSVTSSIIASCIPTHLMKPFPQNNMQLMTVSGAKGSSVNVSQISCLLGQQELEGRRVPTMISGKTLPCFLPFDTSARSGGYITGRFLTGIRPSEYFFHCMAGREGLIDTAVKTSRSGYLQRCLIKHLEGLKIGYDHTVRDSDGSIVQFFYGEDALDVLKQKVLTKFDFCAMNFRQLMKRFNPKQLQNIVDENTAPKYIKKQKKALLKDDSASHGFSDPVMSLHSPSRFLGSVSDKFHEELTDYIKGNKSGLLDTKSNTRKNKWQGVPAKKDRFEALMQLKYQNSLADPGEAVGLLAAQSIGEPSTQMTLNTFHFAGFGAKNVTLGIPRLREIVMSASDHIKTPMMKMPLKSGVTQQAAESLSKSMTKIILSKLIDNAEVSESFRVVHGIREVYKETYRITQDELCEAMERFTGQLDAFIGRELQNRIKKDAPEEIGAGVVSSSFKEAQSEKETDEDKTDKATEKQGNEMDDDDDVSVHEGDGDTTDMKANTNQQQTASYESDADEEPQNADESIESVEDDESTKDQPSNTDRSAAICGRTKFIVGFKFNQKSGTSCEIDLEFPFETRKLLMISIIEAVSKKCVVSEVKGLTRAFIMANDAETDTSINLGTEGVNLMGMWDPMIHNGMIDVDCISTNDVSAILKTYGVEAARASIVNEVAGVFGVYGISVDQRHLGLIADYMTFEGGYKAFNRIGMNSNPSPLAQMSFETTTAFLTTATVGGDIDTLMSPSARIVLGKLVEGGTGSFDVIQPIK